MGSNDRDPIDRLAEQLEREARTKTLPAETGAIKRKLVTGGFGVPIWLHALLREAGVQHVRMIELGGRGVLTEAGWVSIDELHAVAAMWGDADAQ